MREASVSGAPGPSVNTLPRTIVVMSSPMGPVAEARLIRPFRDFLHTEAAGGIVLVFATVVALIWANSPFSNSYQDLWGSTVTIAFRDHVLTLNLRTWVNDGLMTVFFFVVGLEIKRELVVGELRDRRTAALPAIAAVGGMLVPAAIYLAFNAGGDGARGWGIPMATDIAMAVGVLSLLGSRINPSLKLFLLALAIVDDIGAIVVIAIFYSNGIDAGSLAVAALLVAAVLLMRTVGLRAVWPYVVVGAALWLAVHESGVHATITGVVLGLLAPTRAPRSQDTVDVDKLADVSTVEAARETDRARARVGLGRGTTRARDPPVVELRDRAALRPRERRGRHLLRLDRRSGAVTDHPRGRDRPRGRQVRRHQPVRLARMSARHRRPSVGHELVGDLGSGGHRRDRLHRVDLRLGSRVRARAPRRPTPRSGSSRPRSSPRGSDP